ERPGYLKDICEQCLGLPGGDFTPPEGGLHPGPGLGPGSGFGSPACSHWVSMGPLNVTCVIRALAAHPANADVLYAAGEFGGVWKTGNGGGYWSPTMDQELNLHVDAVGLCRAHPDVVYAGMSNGNRGASIDLYRSDDGAASWVRKSDAPSSNTRALA